MAKTASMVGPKWAERTASASTEYVEGVRTTDKDQSARAIAAIPIMVSAFNEAAAKGRIAKGLQRSGKAGHIRGVEEKGAQNFATGVSAPSSLQKYITNSGRYDSARNASASMVRGTRGSAQNIAKVTAVANALHAVKIT